jgi:flagellar hook-length control protein FliK
MTSTPVADKGVNGLQFSNSIKGKQNVTFLSDKFTQVMEQTKNVQENQKNSVPVGDKISLKRNKDELETDWKSQNKKELLNKDKTVSNEIVEKESDQLNEEIQLSGEKLMKKLSEILGISEDEIMEAMEALSITMQDLLNPEKLTTLFMSLSGESDMVSLVTNGELYGKFSELMRFVDDLHSKLSNEYELLPEELMNLLNSDHDAIKKEENSKSNSVIENTLELEAAKDLSMTDVTQQSENLTEINEDATKISDETDLLKTDQSEVVSGNEESEIDSVQKNEMSQSDSRQSGQEDTQENQQNYVSQESVLTGETIKFGEVQKQSTADLLKQANQLDLMKQVTEAVKFQMKPEVTTLEMQLNPANLGNINLQVASKEGVITAQITVQNEVVKEAMETHMIQLKESLQEQGLKVESVEVSVSAHSFERNLGQQDSGNEEQASRQKKQARRINLTNLTEAELSLLTNDEKMAVQLMEENGNTVDYTA